MTVTNPDGGVVTAAEVLLVRSAVVAPVLEAIEPAILARGQAGPEWQSESLIARLLADEIRLYLETEEHARRLAGFSNLGESLAGLGDIIVG